MSHSDSCENISSTRMVNERTNGHSCPNGAMCSNNEPVLEKDSFCVKSETPCKEIDSLTISQTGASCNSETSEVLVDVDEESDEPDSSAEPKARKKYCLFELTTQDTNKHIISKIECDNFRKYFRKNDEIISVNGTTSFSHTEIVNCLNRGIEDFYKEQSTLIIKVKRVEDGITEFITFTIQYTEVEEDGPSLKIFKNFKIFKEEVSFEYLKKIPTTIKRLRSYSHQKYLKHNGNSISMEEIDSEKNRHFQFLYTEYQVGPSVEGLYKYMCCIQDMFRHPRCKRTLNSSNEGTNVQDASNKTFLCSCYGKKGIQFKSMQSIVDDSSAKIVKGDDRFFFRTESREITDINYFQSVMNRNHYIAYNAVDGLCLKKWTTERSGEFEFELVDI